MTILVLGAGYAGLAAAVQLTARLGGDEVTVVDAGELFTERMRRHLTATGQPVARLSVPELLRGARFVRGRVTGVDVRTRTVRVEDKTTLTYNTLVYALGTVPDAPAEDHVYTLNGTGRSRSGPHRSASTTGARSTPRRSSGPPAPGWRIPRPASRPIPRPHPDRPDRRDHRPERRTRPGVPDRAGCWPR